MAAELIPRRPVHTTAFKCTIGAVEAYLCTSGYQNDKKHTSRREVYPLLSNVLVFFYFVFFFYPQVPSARNVFLREMPRHGCPNDTVFRLSSRHNNNVCDNNFVDGEQYSTQKRPDKKYRLDSSYYYPG